MKCLSVRERCKLYFCFFIGRYVVGSLQALRLKQQNRTQWQVELSLRSNMRI